MNNNAIEQFINAVKEPEYETNTTYSAVVSRVDSEGVVWVNLAGSEKETPTASTSADVKAGDVVTVQWRNNKLYIAGNYSNPSAGVIRVANVEAAANTAREAANNAVADAGRARDAAEQAEATAESVHDIAVQASIDAGEAEQSANQANLYANSALTTLGIVENVLDTLDWITKHGYYQVTADTSVVTNKIYYSLTGTAIASPTGNPSLNLYYERSGSGTEADPYVYALSADTAVDEQKTYYSVTAVSIANPTGNPSENGYYELQINSALSQYVSTHLSLTNDGLLLLNDNSSGSMLLSTDGVMIKNAQGITVGQYGEGATIGAMTSQHISIVNGQINFWAGNESDPTNLVAYVSGQELHIPRVVVVQSLQMGDWRWDATIENHLSLNWIGG